MKHETVGWINQIKIYAVTILMIVGFVSSLISYINYERVHRIGVYTSATVTSITDVKYDNDGRPLTYGIAAYYDTENQMHTYSGYIGHSMNEGDMIQLMYNRDNPDEVLRNTGSAVWLAGTIFFGVLAVPLVILSLKILPRKQPKEKYSFDY